MRFVASRARKIRQSHLRLNMACEYTPKCVGRPVLISVGLSRNKLHPARARATRRVGDDDAGSDDDAVEKDEGRVLIKPTSNQAASILPLLSANSQHISAFPELRGVQVRLPLVASLGFAPRRERETFSPDSSFRSIHSALRLSSENFPPYPSLLRVSSFCFSSSSSSSSASTCLFICLHPRSYRRSAKLGKPQSD